MEDLNSVGEQRPSNDDGDDIEKTTKKPRKFKKAPGAPKRFRSAFIFFSQHRHKEIQESLAKEGDSKATTSVAKIVSEEWRTMGHDERSKWEKLAQLDKERFENEKATYRGPWTVPIGHRKSKDPSAPKRPASAFLAFSNSRRASVKKKNPDATNAEVSRALSKMWKEAPEEIRKKYTDEEAIERKEYKVRIADWRQNQEENQKRTSLNAVLSSQQGGEVGVTSASTVSSSGGHHNAVLHAIRGDSQRSSHDQAPVVSTGTPQAVGSSVAIEHPGAIGNHQHPFVLSGLQPNESTNILMNNLLQLQNNNQAVGAPWDGATSGVNQNLAAALGTNINALSDIERLRYVLAQQQSMATIQQELTGLANTGSSLLDQQYSRGSLQAASTGGVPGQADNHQQWLDPASLLHRLSQQANAANPQTQTLPSFGVPTTHVNDLQRLGLLVAPDQQLANSRLQPESVPSGTIHSLLQLQQALAASGQLLFDTSTAPALQDGTADDPEPQSTSRIPKRGRETDMGGETTTSSSSTSQNNKISRKGLL